ncbi:MAG TPA: DUF2157 domain-containing protein [Cyclobacteriaceae bacterium]|nr:DUF2157 domain-containing protein [Cyclobacteriaceae bacterium]
MPKLTRELEELQAAGVITPEVAEKIRAYYDKPSSGASRMVIAFGILGALLIGMGVVLIIAHNWDDLSTGTKLFIGLAPMAIAQGFAAWFVFKQVESSAWRESISVILVFAVATAISVVSQVYNISGSLGGFLLAWTILTLPIIYILRSWMASLLYWIGITWYATEVGFAFISFRRHFDPQYYPLLAMAALPFYFMLIKRLPDSNSISFHNWIIAISLTITLPLGHYTNGDELIVGAYSAMFSAFILIGQLPYFASRRMITNAWLIMGSAGTIILLLALTFEWIDVADKDAKWWLSMPLLVWSLLFVAASGLLYKVGSKIGYKNVLSKSYAYLVFIVLFVIGIGQPLIARGLTNVLILALGIYTIREGALADKLWKMNYGVLILSILIMCRFFDTDMSFVVRGLLFVAIGLGFFGTNFYMMRKRKAVA